MRSKSGSISRLSSSCLHLVISICHQARYQWSPCQMVGGWVKVIAGSFQTLEGPIQAGSKVGFLDIHLEANQKLSHSVDPQSRTLLYVYEGQAHIEGQVAEVGHLVALRLRLRSRVDHRTLERNASAVIVWSPLWRPHCSVRPICHEYPYRTCEGIFGLSGRSNGHTQFKRCLARNPQPNAQPGSPHSMAHLGQSRHVHRCESKWSSTASDTVSGFG